MADGTPTMADPGMQSRMIQELLPFIMGKNTKFTVDENNDINLKTNYAQTQAKNLGAQTQATEQAGLPSYGGIDADMVLKLMGQRGQQDAQMAGQTGRDMQGMYQGALTQQILGDPQRREQDIRAKLAMQMLAGQQQQANIGATGEQSRLTRGTPLGQTDETSRLKGAQADYYAALAKDPGRGRVGSTVPQQNLDFRKKQFADNYAADLADKKIPWNVGIPNYNNSIVPDDATSLLTIDDDFRDSIESVDLAGVPVGMVRSLASKLNVSTNDLISAAYKWGKRNDRPPIQLIKQKLRDAGLEK